MIFNTPEQIMEMLAPFAEQMAKMNANKMAMSFGPEGEAPLLTFVLARGAEAKALADFNQILDDLDEAADEEDGEEGSDDS